MLLNFLRVLAITNACWLIGGGMPWHTGTSGTFDTALMAVMVPMFLNRKWALGLIPIGVAIYLQGEGTAGAVLLMQLCAGVSLSTAIGWVIVPTVLLLAAFNWEAVQQLVRDHMLRIEMWDAFLSYWWDKSASRAIGFGNGTFKFHAPLLEIRGKHYVWAHNDWIEILFEHGFIGLAFALCAFAYLLYRTKNNTRNFCTVLGFGTCMFFYSPLQVVTGQLIFAMILLEVFKDTRRKS